MHFPPPSILNRVKNDVADSGLVKTINKLKYSFYCFIACSVEVACIGTVFILENTFGNIKIGCFLPTGK